jgi:hypothetical protein
VDCIVGPCSDAESTSLEQEQREKTIIYVFDVDVAEITPSALDENPCTSTAIDSVSESRLNDKTFLPCKKFCIDQKHRKEKLKEIQCMAYLITCTAWRVLCEDKEKKKKVSLLNGKEK